MNKRRVIRKGHPPNKKDPGELDNSEAKVRHREAEQKRRAATRQLQDQISVFFLVQGKKEVSIGDVLLFGKSSDSRSESAVYSPTHFSCHLSKNR